MGEQVELTQRIRLDVGSWQGRWEIGYLDERGEFVAVAPLPLAPEALKMLEEFARVEE
jgi:hypothetical protein